MKFYLSANIKEYRRVHQLTQTELAELIGVSPQAISKWEREICYPDLFLLPSIAKLLQVSIDDLILHPLQSTP